MKNVTNKQVLTATRTATETATVVNVFQRAGSQNYYVRFKPSEAALPLFGHRKDIWISTETSDKREAEKRAIGLLADMLAKQKQYIEDFLPTVHRRFLECKTEAERTDTTLKMTGGYLYKEFLRQQELLELQLKVVGLWDFAKSRPSVDVANTPLETQLQVQSLNHEATTIAVQATSKAGRTKPTDSKQNITPVVVERVFSFAAKVRRAGNSTETARAREGKRLIAWMKENKVAELTPQKAKEYTSYLNQKWAFKTAAQRFSLTSYALM